MHKTNDDIGDDILCTAFEFHIAYEQRYLVTLKNNCCHFHTDKYLYIFCDFFYKYR